ncbi:MAG: hypothetical protein HZB56_16200 [Deltaproteobacteria bacterium]|nr:hypothetical protein [Deltaproteobacteria bacterium]
MAGLLFVTQVILDTWAGQGKIDFAGNVMTILAGEGSGRAYTLLPAVRILRVVGADADPNGLVHKVKAEAQLREMGAEILSDAVVMGDVAYEVEPGFMAEAAALQAAAASVVAPAVPVDPPAPPVAAGSAPASAQPAGAAAAAGQELDPQELERRRKEAETLARFLLENLS